jgi:hypothetical protein
VTSRLDIRTHQPLRGQVMIVRAAKLDLLRDHHEEQEQPGKGSA